MTVVIGIDVEKGKHDCFILNSGGEIPEYVLTTPNTLEGFDLLLSRLGAHTTVKDKIKVGLEETL